MAIAISMEKQYEPPIPSPNKEGIIPPLVETQGLLGPAFCEQAVS
jgi:hypothetical protein